MSSRFLDPIPIEFQPREEENCPSKNVIRGVYSKEMNVSNFLPSFIEKPINPKSFVSLNSSHYSLSVFRTLEDCKKRLKNYKKIWNSICGFAIGSTSLCRGIALRPDNRGHIDYFLFDYLSNNPCSDFVYFCDK